MPKSTVIGNLSGLLLKCHDLLVSPLDVKRNRHIAQPFVAKEGPTFGSDGLSDCPDTKTYSTVMDTARRMCLACP